ncbi:MAG: hypothetical protein HUU32_16910 [Calditrichaceae bacterium]|nr:RAMP superfamily CRISPR-associated protein [Calditrichia bacterium]NUQ43072.1 hypothetical protein [Calditrichaceae bacterium]
MANPIDSRTKIDFPFFIVLDGAMAVGSGFSRGQIQRTVVRGLDSLPYIPASTLKGRARDAAARLARTLGIYVCPGPNPKQMCGAKGSLEDACLLCRTFGSPGVSSASGQTGLIWRDARICDSQGQPITITDSAESEAFYYAKTQVQLSRQRATALEKHLFTTENTVENLRFKGRIRGWLLSARMMAGQYPAEIVLLLSALKLLNFVGGGKSRGLGFCTVELPDKITIGDQDVDTTAILANVSNLFNKEDR